MKSNEDDFDLLYDSDSVKSTESIHEARKKIENPRKIISLLNNLSTLDLNDPVVKAEFLKNVIDFEEKYGKLDDEGSPLTKRSKESNLNTDRNPASEKAENNEPQAKNQDLALNTNTLEEKAKQIEKEINENQGKLEINLAEKLEDLKKNYEELIKSDRIALETLSKEQNADALNLNQPLFITTNENQDRDLLFLTSPSSLNKITEKDSGSKQQTLITEENNPKKENDPTAKSENEINIKKTDKNSEGINEISQENSKKENKLDELKANKNNENSLTKENDLERKITKNQSLHSKASNTSKNSKQKRVPQVSKHEKKEKPSSIHQSSKKEINSFSEKKMEKNNNSIPNNNENMQNSQKNSPINDKKSPSKYKNKEESNHEKNKKDSDSSADDSFEAGDLDELLSPKTRITSEKKGKQPLLKGLSSSNKKKLHKKMPTLDLASVSNKENISQFKYSSQSQNQIDLSEHENISELNSSSQLVENEGQSMEENNEFSADNLGNNLENLISSEENRISFPTSQQNREFISSSRKEYQFSERSEYEMINNEILDEDLEILIKTSENNNKMNYELGENDEEINKKLNEERDKVIKKLEKQFGKEHARKKIKQIEKQILRQSQKQKVYFN